MRVQIYVQEGCPSCKSILAYLEHRYVGIEVMSVDNIKDIPDKNRRSTVRGDLASQQDETPLVYIDGEYQDLPELKKKAATLPIAQRCDGDHCKADFLFG